MQVNVASTGENQSNAPDLGPLAWVLDELRKSLDGATKALRRFVRDAALSRGSDLAALDASQLRIARQQLHQAVGALEMVGMPAPAKVLRAMEALAQRFVQRPEQCSDEATNKVERASFALIEYLEGVLKGKQASSVALFPQYRDLQELLGEERIHPADLWPHDWRWVDVDIQNCPPAQGYDAVSRSRIEGYVLNVVKTGNVSTSKAMRDVSLGFAANQSALEPRVFWKICAAYFEAVAKGLCPSDVYAKRVASRIFLQYRTLIKGDADLSIRLAQDLLFFCAQAVPVNDEDTPVLAAVRRAYGLTGALPFSYDKPQFGRFDPAMLVQARRRIASATETWSALAGGETNRLKAATDQFALVADSVVKLHPESSALAQALTAAVETTTRSSEAPPPALAMEVATAILFLEAAYEDMDPTDSNMPARSAGLARRLVHVNAGGDPEPLEGWMEELYRRVSDRQIMGSVVDELRTTLSDVEKSLDAYFRDSSSALPLHEVPSQLAQMRGVFSVLGLDQAAIASLRMRATVERFLADGGDASFDRNTAIEKLGNSLGALGFLIDMLSYQRELAKKLFVYDEEAGEFKPVMGRERQPDVGPTASPEMSAVLEDTGLADANMTGAVEETAVQAAAISIPAPEVQTPTPTRESSIAEIDNDDEEIDLKEIFLEEAREVAKTGLEAVHALADQPDDLGQLTTLRRAFHTLKGSSRMVGLTEFGEGGWAMEQLLNSWLADRLPASPSMLDLCGDALQGFSRWIEDIAVDEDAAWEARVFREAADAMRLEGRRVEMLLPGDISEAFKTNDEDSQEGQPDFASTELADAATSMLDFKGHLVAQEQSDRDGAESQSLNLDDFDFGEFPDAETVLLVPEGEREDCVDSVRAATEVDEESVTTSGAPLESLIEPEPELAFEEQVKVIGGLRIDIPLYNVYLNEADEWSRRLLTELSEWALELHKPLPESTLALTHSLAGSSATVGFGALSEISRVLEHALDHVRLHIAGTPEHAQLFVESAEDIRRLLHQFAAGFLKEPNPSLVEALKKVLEIDASSGYATIDDELSAVEVPVDEDPIELESNPLDNRGEGAGEIEPLLDELQGAEESVNGDTDSFMADEIEAAVVPATLATKPVEQLFAHNRLDDDDSDIEATDQLDVDLLPIFEEEALELLPQLGGALRQWAAHPGNLGARNEALRVLHTLKGSARLAGAMQMGELSHRMESAIEHMGSDSLDQSQIEPLMARLDTIQANFGKLRAIPEQELLHPESAQDDGEPLSSDAEPESSDTTETVTQPGDMPVAPSVPTGARVAAAALEIAPSRKGSNQSVRVRAQLLDRLVNQAGEVMITRSRLEVRLGQLRGSLGDLTGNLDRLRGQLRDIELQSESQMQSRLAQAKDSAQGFDPLEFDRFTRVQELTRMMAESVDDVATVHRNLQRTVEGTEDDLVAQRRQARELQRDLLRTRMVEFDGISDRLYGVVRQAAKETGKQVKLDIRGALEMDRGVLDRMAPAFEHLLRNSVVHGVESPELRLEAGKPAVGTIVVQLQQQSNDVTVEFQDDGAGLNLDRILEKAQAEGYLAEGATPTDLELADFIFTPGFSTASQVTELAGRGIGLDVVRAEVNALGGRIETTTKPGQGTTFKLVLPLTTAVTQVVMLRLGDKLIGVPANLIETVRRVPADSVDQAYQAHVFESGSEMLPFYWAGALLQSSPASVEARTKTLPVVVFRSAGQGLAMHVDEVLGNQEVVVKHLGPQLSRLPGLTGMSVLASGVVVLIYNPVALASVYGKKAQEFKRQGEEQASAAGSSGAAASASLSNGPGQAPLVLVVDDSITVRRVTQRLLKREGFRVALAADGLQALERLRDEIPSVVLSDIEMPRMDGFDLVRNIRGDTKMHDLPVIMITSRIAEKHRELARELGVDHYLGKPYSEDTLVELVRTYCVPTIDA
ncbi:Hpt domain-containing protein [Rhodoferax sp. PAMC 29310]|uniref:hybrid sensor histidine kinase/response regulator n=1 Tax=Rhodoferax sp. PAMC 29310 TaxID=2822760 RepID=UPI001B332885|nr:Hpt domain-containing protein [Rhodoferax sp. PAMC 29310]